MEVRFGLHSACMTTQNGINIQQEPFMQKFCWSTVYLKTNKNSKQCMLDRIRPSPSGYTHSKTCIKNLDESKIKSQKFTRFWGPKNRNWTQKTATHAGWYWSLLTLYQDLIHNKLRPALLAKETITKIKTSSQSRISVWP